MSAGLWIFRSDRTPPTRHPPGGALLQKPQLQTATRVAPPKRKEKTEVRALKFVLCRGGMVVYVFMRVRCVHAVIGSTPANPRVTHGCILYPDYSIIDPFPPDIVQHQDTLDPFSPTPPRPNDDDRSSSRRRRRSRRSSRWCSSGTRTTTRAMSSRCCARSSQGSVRPYLCVC